jgi:hypothetical protein
VPDELPRRVSAWRSSDEVDARSSAANSMRSTSSSLPQRGDGIGHELIAANCQRHEGRAVDRQLMHEQRRRVVEELGVVDGE